MHNPSALQEPGFRTDLHEERLAAVIQELRATGAESVIDLGCGDGTLLLRLAGDDRFSRLAGLDSCPGSLAEAEEKMRDAGLLSSGRVTLHHASFDSDTTGFGHFHAAVMVEAIEHLDPRRLSAVEHALFALQRPRTVVITTPNQDYNVIYGLPPGTLRHTGHRFEWSRTKFRSWAARAGLRNGYGVRFRGVGAEDNDCGQPTQMAIFQRLPRPAPDSGT